LNERCETLGQNNLQKGICVTVVFTADLGSLVPDRANAAPRIQKGATAGGFSFKNAIFVGRIIQHFPIFRIDAYQEITAE
jgi:hypothetical protein